MQVLGAVGELSVSAPHRCSGYTFRLALKTQGYSKPKGTQFSRVLISIMASAFMKTKKHTRVCQSGSFCFIERQMILCFMHLSHFILLFFVILFDFLDKENAIFKRIFISGKSTAKKS